MRFYTHRWGLCAGFEVRNWHFSVFLNPNHWAVDYHKNATCCKWWLIIGPFEINRIWTDDDEYPFYVEDDAS
jgi:hypothetical protein